MTLGQRVVVRVAFDGVDPCELSGEEREACCKLFGDAERIPEAARRIILAVCGRRGGKSYLFEGLWLLHSMYTVPLWSVAPGQLPIAMVISLNDGLRQEVTNYAFGAARADERLASTLVLPAALRDAPIVSEFMVRRPGTRELVGFRGGVATKGGYGGRGKSLVAAALDEAAFFRDENNVVSDEDIFAACIPGLLPDAKLCVASTPWAQAGLVWRLFAENHGQPKTAVVAHAATQVLRPELADEVEAERERDPDRTATERDALFKSMGTTQFFSDALIEGLFSRDVPYPMPAIPGTRSAAAADLGLRSDSSAFVGTMRMPHDPTIYVSLMRELRPEPGKPLKPSEVCTIFAGEAASIGAPWVMVDGHYIESMRENAVTLRVAPAPASPSEVYVTARALMRDGRCKIAHPDTQTGETRVMLLRLKAQLREVKGRPIPGGGMSITLPKWNTGGHCDLVAALVLAVYQHGGTYQKPDAAKEGSPAWERAQLEERKKAMRAKASAKWRPGM